MECAWVGFLVAVCEAVIVPAGCVSGTEGARTVDVVSSKSLLLLSFCLRQLDISFCLEGELPEILGFGVTHVFPDC